MATGKVWVSQPSVSALPLLMGLPTRIAKVGVRHSSHAQSKDVSFRGVKLGETVGSTTAHVRTRARLRLPRGGSCGAL